MGVTQCYCAEIDGECGVCADARTIDEQAATIARLTQSLQKARRLAQMVIDREAPGLIRRAAVEILDEKGGAK